MNNLNQKINSILQERNALLEKYQKELQTALVETCREFFENNPTIKLICWTQYTPYFNDGDTCTFRVNDIYFSNAEGDDVNDITGYGEYEGESETVFSENIWGLNYYKIKNVDVDQCKIISDMLTTQNMADIMESIPGVS